MKKQKSVGMVWAIRAFTLTELLVVVTVIAILAGVAITMTDGMEKNAIRSKDMANQAEIRKALSYYFSTHNQKYPDGWNTLISDEYADADASLAGTAVDGATAFAMFYRGNLTEADKAAYGADNTGIYGQLRGWSATGASNQNAWRKCTVYYMKEYEGFNRANIRTLYYHQPSKIPNRSADDQVDATTGDRVSGGEAVTQGYSYVSGVPVAIIDRKTPIGKQLYRDMGQDPEIPYSSEDAGTTSVDNTSNPNDYFVLVVLGLGNRNQILGDKSAGLERAPESSGVDTLTVNHYLPVFKVYQEKKADAELVGVLDARGDTMSRQTRMYQGIDE